MFAICKANFPLNCLKCPAAQLALKQSILPFPPSPPSGSDLLKILGSLPMAHLQGHAQGRPALPRLYVQPGPALLHQEAGTGGVAGEGGHVQRCVACKRRTGCQEARMPRAQRSVKNDMPCLTHSFPTAKQLFPGFFTFFYAILHFQDLNMIPMPNSHLVLHKVTLKQHFEG